MDAHELRRLHGAATPLRDEIIAILAPNARDWSARNREAQKSADAIIAILNGRNSHAADRLARIEAVVVDPETIALAILNSDRAMAGLPPTDSRANCPDSDGYVTNATAALAALRELIGAEA